MIRISLDNVNEKMKVAKTVYSSDGRALLSRGSQIKPTYVQKLKEAGIFWIYTDDEKTRDIVIRDVVSEETKREMLVMVKEVINKLKNGKIKYDISKICDIVDKMVDEVLSHKDIMIHILDVRSYEDYLYAHSVSTSIFTVVCGIAHKYNKIKLRDLGVGSLLHDVGKIKVPPEVLDKPGKLNDKEWEAMKQHTVWGFEMLRQQKELNLLSTHVSYQHHERCDGCGYPRGLSKSEILDYAKIVSISDVYDALTADRVYRNKFLPHQAMEIIQAGQDSQFTPDLITKFFENVAMYPVGSQVELSNGLKGVVSKVKKGYTFRPKVKIFYNEKGEEVLSPYNLDLMDDLELKVIRVFE